MNEKYMIEDESLFRKKLRYIREKNGLTKSELSKRTGLSVATLINLEKGDILPKRSTLDKLSSELGVPVSYLTSVYDAKNIEDFDEEISKSNYLVKIPYASIDENGRFNISSELCFYFPVSMISEYANVAEDNLFIVEAKKGFGKDYLMLFKKTDGFKKGGVNLVQDETGKVGVLEAPDLIGGRWKVLGVLLKNIL